ncbi:BQ2448_4080 [Microbotryum intermedium]|uniref:BQ2448_4080 protein n=1 Tax=Microbotryum intermedium TaxID=269621 RepID=A0A238FKM2_9BASI|nr:BQ2448_4080 [Microbotryum intermedium]
MGGIYLRLALGSTFLCQIIVIWVKYDDGDHGIPRCCRGLDPSQAQLEPLEPAGVFPLTPTMPRIESNTVRIGCCSFSLKYKESLQPALHRDARETISTQEMHDYAIYAARRYRGVRHHDGYEMYYPLPQGTPEKQAKVLMLVQWFYARTGRPLSNRLP